MFLSLRRRLRNEHPLATDATIDAWAKDAFRGRPRKVRVVG